MHVYLISIAPACMSKPRLPQAKIYIKERYSSLFNFKLRNIFYSFNEGYVCSNVTHQKNQRYHY